LQLAFVRTRTLREDIEDQARPVDDPAGDYFFEIALLRRGQFVINDDKISVLARDHIANLLGFTFADETCRIRPLPRTENEMTGVGTRRLHQLAKLFNLAVGGVTRKAHMNKNRALARSARRRNWSEWITRCRAP